MKFVVTHPFWRPYEADANLQRQAIRVAFRQTEPGPLEAHQLLWSAHFTLVCRLIVEAIPDRSAQVRHVGSTAVPGLLAKPVIDIDLTVPDVAAEETYVPRLESTGFRLIFRDDVAGDAHRHLTFTDPNTNLHVWTPNAVEPRRHELFVAWLRTNHDDRQRYAHVKRAAAEAHGTRRYNDTKAAVIYDIYEKIFLADAAHIHTPQPRH